MESAFDSGKNKTEKSKTKSQFVRSDDNSRVISRHRLPKFETVLSGICLPAFESGVSRLSQLLWILEEIDLPGFLRLYDLRHTCATLLLLAGENPKVVSERLGHSSVTMTLETYSHVLPNMQRSATVKLEQMLFG